MPDLFTNQFSDVVRMARSKTILSPAVGTYNLVRIPRFSFVSDVVLWVKVAGSADTVQVGWAGNGETADPDGILTEGDAEVTATGFKRAKYDYGTSDYVTWSGKYFGDASGMITMTAITADQTSGEFYVFATYFVVH